MMGLLWRTIIALLVAWYLALRSSVSEVDGGVEPSHRYRKSGCGVGLSHRSKLWLVTQLRETGRCPMMLLPLVTATTRSTYTYHEGASTTSSTP